MTGVEILIQQTKKKQRIGRHVQVYVEIVDAFETDNRFFLSYFGSCLEMYFDDARWNLNFAALKSTASQML